MKIWAKFCVKTDCKGVPHTISTHFALEYVPKGGLRQTFMVYGFTLRQFMPEVFPFSVKPQSIFALDLASKSSEKKIRETFFSHELRETDNDP